MDCVDEVVAEQDGAAAGAERRRRDEGRSRAGARKADIVLSMDWAETGARQLAGEWRGGEGSQNELLLGMDRGTLHKMFPREIAITTSSLGNWLLAHWLVPAILFLQSSPDSSSAVARNKLPCKPEK